MRKKSKRRIRRRRRFIMLIIIVLAIFVLVKINKKKNIIDIDIDFSPVHNYCRNTINMKYYDIKDEWNDVITEYLNLYTASLQNLKAKDVTRLFTDKDDAEAYLAQTAINTQVYHHQKQLNDMRLLKAYYDIEYTYSKVKDGLITIRFKESDYYNFAYLDNITSKVLDVENTIVLYDNNGKITIESIRADRDNYAIFTSVLEERFTKKEIDTLNKYYLESIDKEVIKNKELLDTANKTSYRQTKTCDHSYDREKALAYSYKYIDDSNGDYINYAYLGGNCANYASQSIHEGGVPMDYFGDEQWKYYSDSLNEKNEKSGRSSSWVSTYYFYKYAKNNTGYGLCSEVDVNLFYAEPGDVIHVGYKKDPEYSHTTLVSKIIRKDGKIIDILVNSNTTNLENYPLFAYVYHNKRLIKILGYND